MKFTGIASLATLFLVGCATPTSQSDIDRYAKTYYHCHICAAAGMLDQETAAKGMAFISSNVYREDTPRLQESAQRYAAMGVKADQKNCDDLRLHILEAVAAKSMKPVAPTQAYQATYTNCNTYFGQTFCTTY